jgi:hypothetical protein
MPRPRDCRPQNLHIIVHPRHDKSHSSSKQSLSKPLQLHANRLNFHHREAYSTPEGHSIDRDLNLRANSIIMNFRLLLRE